MNEWVYDSINNGVYKTGFATSQKAYEENVKGLFEGLARVETLLEDGRKYLLGDALTEAGILGERERGRKGEGEGKGEGGGGSERRG